MIIMGIIIIIYGPISIIFAPHITAFSPDCGINKELEYYYISADPQWDKNDARILFAIAGILYIIWDVTTLISYAVKIRMFRKYKETQPIVYQRVLSILYKIFIVT